MGLTLHLYYLFHLSYLCPISTLDSREVSFIQDLLTTLLRLITANMVLFSNFTTVWSFVALLAAVTVFLLGRSAFERRQMNQQHGCSDPPKYPHRDPFGYDLFAARQSATLQGRSGAFDLSLFAAYGRTFKALRWGTWRQTVIWTSEPGNIQTVAALSFDHFEFRTLRQSFGPFMGDGLLTTDGAEWAHSREMVRPVFRRSRIGDFAVFEVHVKRFLDLLPQDGSTVDVQPLLKRLVPSTFSAH